MNKKGYSLGEVLITLGILAVLLAVSVPAVIHFSKVLNQVKLDNTAREIFIGAQNKLTAIKSSGAEMPNGTSMPEKPSDFDDADIGEWLNTGSANDPFVYVISGDESFKFMDDTPVGEDYQEGKYVIEFNRNTGDVYGVFYWEPAELDFGGDSDFSYPANFNTYTKGSDTYNVRSGRNERMAAKVGYYGSNGTKGSIETKLFTLNTELENADYLRLKIRPNNMTVGKDIRYTITMRSLTVLTNDAVYTIRLQYLNGNAYQVKFVDGVNDTLEEITLPYVTADAASYGFDIIFDSVEANKHFADNFKGIAAGDDIEIKVEAQYLGTAGNYVLDGAAPLYEANSLFADKRMNDIGGYSAMGSVALIETGRHLQNLSRAASNLGYYEKKIGDVIKTGKTSVGFKKAVLNSDIDWQGAEYNYKDVNTLYNSTSLLNSFYPISNYETDLREFDGGGHTISNMYITQTTK